jgi:L-alanine-DL-glutamate epimerase-like enolase superfamily enzyme
VTSAEGRDEVTRKRAIDVDVPVESLEVSAYAVPTDAPEADGTIAWNKTTMVVAEPVAAGVRGLGWSYTGVAAAAVVDEPLASCVVGRSALDVPGMATAMALAVRNLGRPGLVATAISAVDVALWDLKAKLLGLPLCRLLGQVNRELRVYGSGGFTTYDQQQTEAQLGHWVHDQGIPRVKIKIGESWGSDESRDLARVELAKAVIGDAELYVDANGGYSRGQAVRMGHRFDAAGVRWYEEPVSSDDLHGLAEIRGEVAADVAAGEYGYDLGYFQRMCDAQAVDCLQIDATRCGGVTEFLRAAAVAAGHHLQVSSHCAPNLHAHIAAAVPNLRHMEWFHDHVRIESTLFTGALDPSGGTVTPDQSRPGIGMALREEESARYRVR